MSKYMKKWGVFYFLIYFSSFSCFGKLVEIVPNWENVAKDREVIVTQEYENATGFWDSFYYKLAQEEYQIVITNENRAGKGDVIVWGNIGSQNRVQKIKKLKKTKPWIKHIFIHWEPPLHEISLTSEILDLFDWVLSWNEEMEKRPNFRKFGLLVPGEVMENTPTFSERKLVTMVLGGQSSDHPQELYFMRKKWVEFYEALSNGEEYFDFYGHGWKENIYKRYLGRVPNSSQTMTHYKFTFAFENWENDVGYISEKIFCSFAAGAVPVYLGAKNIQKYIPEECYIDMGAFSFEDMHRYLVSMKEEEWESYRAAIKKFLASDQAKIFTDSYKANVLAEAVMF